MPFDPDAYLASKAKPASFDPDAYLASKGATSVPAPASEPEDKRSAGRKVYDALRTPGEVMGSMVTGAVAAPIADVAGLAATGYEALAHGGKGDGEMPGKFRDRVRDSLTYHPSSPGAQAVLGAAGSVAAPVARAGAAVADSVRGDAPANSPRGMAANAAIEGVKQAPGFLGIKGAQQVPRVAAAGERAADTLMGTSARAARTEAQGATRQALGDVDANLGRQQAGKITEANQYADEAVRTQRTLDAARQRGVPTSDALGGQVRDAYLGVMAQAKKVRESVVDPLYAQAKAAAAAREAQGQFIDVKPAVKDLDEMLKLSENLPDLHAKLQRLRQSVESAAPKAAPAAPVGSGRVTSKMAVPATPAAPARPLSYAELDMASRYIKDIAFSGEAEGYGALIRNTAKRLSVKLDEQIAKSVPEHAAATAKYRELSEPMETLGTRIGSVLYDTEGGLKGDAYAKVSAQDIPGRVFAKRERVEQLIDAMAGGKNASPQARAAAQAKVDTWVENWVLDRTQGKVGAEAARTLATPDMRSTLAAAPGARERLTGTFGREAAAEARVPELNKAADAARADAAAVAKQRVAVRGQIEQADIDLAHGNPKAAYDAYVSALRKSMGGADPERYRAAIALIERAGELEEKTAKARKLAVSWVKGAGYIGAAGLGFNEARKALQ